MLATQKRYFTKPWMSSEETSLIKQRFLDEHLPRLKPVDENESFKKRFLPKQSQLRSSSLFPPIPSGVTTTASTSESQKATAIYNSTRRETVRHSLTRQNLSALSPRSSLFQPTNNALSRRTTRYDYIPSKINTGLPRIEETNRTDGHTYQLGPTCPLNRRLLKQRLVQDTQIRAQAKRIRFNSGVTYTTQLKTLTSLVRSKVKSHLSAVMGVGDERYKIVVQLTVFQTIVGGLHIASRCLWNPKTDNSITIRMQGVDCDLLFVVFLCYTDLGAI